MIEENELLMVLMGLVTLVFIRRNLAELRRYEGGGLVVAAFFFMFAGWLLTVLEGLVWHGLFNFLEHLCYTLGAILFARWVWRITHRKGSEAEQ